MNWAASDWRPGIKISPVTSHESTSHQFQLFSSIVIPSVHENFPRKKDRKASPFLKGSHPMNQASGRVHQFPGRVPPKGTALLTERWPRTSRQSVKVPCFQICFSVFCCLSCCFPNDFSRAEPLGKGRKKSLRLLAAYFFSPEPRMGI